MCYPGASEVRPVLFLFFILTYRYFSDHPLNGISIIAGILHILTGIVWKRVGCVLGIEPNEHQIPRFLGKYSSSHWSLRKPWETQFSQCSPNVLPMSQCCWGVGFFGSVNFSVSLGNPEELWDCDENPMNFSESRLWGRIFSSSSSCSHAWITPRKKERKWVLQSQTNHSKRNQRQRRRANLGLQAYWPLYLWDSGTSIAADSNRRFYSSSFLRQLHAEL